MGPAARSFVLAVLALVLAPAASGAPPQPITALAPVEVWAEGFQNVRGIAVDAVDAIIVADRHAGTVTRIAPDHTRTTLARRLRKPNGLALDESGRIIVAEPGARRVVRLEHDGRHTPLVTGILDPRWLAVADDGALFISARRLTRAIDPAPSDDDEDDDDDEPQMVLVLRGGRLRVFVDGLRRVQGIAVSGDALFVATRGRRDGPREKGVVYRVPILPGGAAGPLATAGAATRFDDPRGLAVDRLGALWTGVARLQLDGHATSDSIAKIAADGAVTRFASRLADPRGLAFDAAGNLYVADGHRGRIVRFLAPPAPTVAALPAFVSASPFAVTGAGQAGARIQVFVNDGDLATTGLAAADGSFSVAVPLALERDNDLDVSATGSAGAGLTSSSTPAAVVHDSIAPVVDFRLPPSTGYIRGQVGIAIDAADAGSGLHALSVVAIGQPFPLTLAPSLPSPATSAVTSWDTTTMVDGTHGVTATATDGAGNVRTVTRTVLVDNTPPDTAIASGPPATVTQTEVSFAFAGTDALTPPSSLTFAWRLDGGAWAPFAAVTSVTLSELGQGLHTFEVKARDLAGNEDATPAAQTFTVQLTQVSLSITSPAAGASVPAGPTVVRGIVGSGGAELGVTVNGVVASRQGDAFVALVDLDVSATTLVAVATSVQGTTVQHVIPVSVVATPPGASILHASPVRGVAPLEVRFRVEGGTALARMELDADGDGAVDVTTPAGEAEFTYGLPGTYVATATLVDTAGNRNVTHAVVEVLELAAFDALLQARWTALKDALRRSDITAALDHVAGRSRSRYAAIFHELTADLPDVDQILTTLTPSEVVGHEAIYEMSRTDDGLVTSFEIRFLLDEDGVWRLWSF